MQDDKTGITEKTAEFIKNKRLAMGMTQKQFALFTLGDEKHADWIGKIERGRGITVLTLERIFKKLNADLIIEEF